MFWILVFLFYILPMGFLVGGAVYAVFNKEFSQKSGMRTWGEVVAIALAGIVPLLNLYVIVMASWEHYGKRRIHG